MLNYPKTLKEARNVKYGSWAGDSDGRLYKEGDCAYGVWRDRAWHSSQCSRKNGHGINGLYCKQHASKLENKKQVY